MKGKARHSGGYHAQRGWYDNSVQRVLKKWSPRLDDTTLNETFHLLRNIVENNYARTIAIQNREHLSFICELSSALHRLFIKTNPAGWLIRLSGLGRSRHAFQACDIQGWKKLWKKIQSGSDPASEYLASGFSNEAKAALKQKSPGDRLILSTLVLELNRVLDGEYIYEKNRFPKVRPNQMAPEKWETMLALDRIQINRSLLEQAYPKELVTWSSIGTRQKLTFEEIRIEIIAGGGPDVSIDALKKAAERLKLSCYDGKVIAKNEMIAHNFSVF